ncbi:hypothetical protein [Micromonospora coerulea]|uniref:hypothetical protein n=1 Tax=Micromonospora coerulea TaxID=47856 RepID=UPI001907B0D5|nr:hypothetical protein [Micromonospora veneta]
MIDPTRDDFVLSFKPHAGYDSPLLAIKDATAAGLADKVGSVEATGLFAIIGNADTAFKAAWNLAKGLDATPVAHPSTVPATGYAPPAQAAPAAAPAGAPPGMTAPSCPHGVKTYKTGQSARGAWQAWMCPARKGDPGQCPPQWIK